MKRAFLEELGIEKEVINKIMDENGKDIEAKKKEISSLTDTLSQKDKIINELNETIKGFDGKEEAIKELQNKVLSYEKAEEKRLESERQAESDRILTGNIMEVIKDKEFVNEFTKNSIISSIKDELTKSGNKGKGAKEIFDSLTKDIDGIFKNPQHEKIELPQNGKGAVETTKKFKNFF